MVTARISWLRAAMASAIVLVTAACSKPPGCGEPETLDLARSVILDEARKIPVAAEIFQNEAAVDPQGIAAGYLKSVEMAFSSITTDGYEANARRNSCHAQLRVRRGKMDDSFAIDYATQLTEDKDSKWIIQVAGIQKAAILLALNAKAEFSQKRFAGQWTGNYACGGMDGETADAKGPFSLPVTASISETNELKLERTTVGGGYESLTGTVSVISGRVSISGQGANSIDDKWKTEFSGKIAGDVLQATGGIQPEGANTLSRSCTLTLQRHGSGAAAANSAHATASEAGTVANSIVPTQPGSSTGQIHDVVAASSSLSSPVTDGAPSPTASTSRITIKAESNGQQRLAIMGRPTQYLATVFHVDPASRLKAGATEIQLVEGSTGGNTCDTFYFFVRTEEGRNPEVSDSVSKCDDAEATIKVEATRLTLLIPESGNAPKKAIAGLDGITVDGKPLKQAPLATQ